jgi:hypothetical protein
MNPLTTKLMDASSSRAKTMKINRRSLHLVDSLYWSLHGVRSGSSSYNLTATILNDGVIHILLGMCLRTHT